MSTDPVKYRWRPRWWVAIERALQAAIRRPLDRLQCWIVGLIASQKRLREQLVQQSWFGNAIEAAREEERRLAGATLERTLETDRAAHRAEWDAACSERIAREFMTSQKPWHWEHLRRDRRPRTRFVFIVGCGHSGTTILHRILSEHPAVHGITKESNLFLNFTDDAILEQLRVWEQEAEAAGREVVLEKTPFHLYCFNRINEFVRHASFVSIVRDGRDVVASYVASGHSMQWGIDYWTTCMQYEEELTRKVRSHHRLTLERLVEDPHRTVSGLLAALGLEAGDELVNRMLRYHEQPKKYYHDTIAMPPNALEGEHMAMLRTYQVNQPLFRDTRRWLRDIPSSKQQELTASLRPWLLAYGYLDHGA